MQTLHQKHQTYNTILYQGEAKQYPKQTFFKEIHFFSFFFIDKQK